MHCVSIAAKSEVISYVAESKHCYRSTSPDCARTARAALPIHSFQFVKDPGTLPRQIRSNVWSCPFQAKNLVLVCPGSVVGARPKVFAAASPSTNRYLRKRVAHALFNYSPVRSVPVTTASQGQFAVVSSAELPH